MIRFHVLPLVLVTAIVFPAGARASDDLDDQAVDFNRDIRGILSENCFACHGPDANRRKGDLRLDVEDDVFADRGDYQVVVPGDTEESELYQRLISDDESYAMPPKESTASRRAETLWGATGMKKRSSRITKAGIRAKTPKAFSRPNKTAQPTTATSSVFSRN